MKHFSYIALFIFSFTVLGQTDIPKKAAKNFNEGYLLFHSAKFEEALPYLQKAVDGYDRYIEAIALLADCQTKLAKYDEAKDNYGKLITISPNDECKVYLQWGRIEIMRDNYSKAIEHFKQCIATKNCKETTMNNAKQKLKVAMFRDSLLNNPVTFNPADLGENINSEFHEYLPMLTADGEQIFYTRRISEPPFYNEDFFESKKDEEGNWLPAINIGEPVNTKSGEGALSISPDGKRLFFAADDRVDGLGNFDIYYSYKKNGKWIDPLNIGWPINTAAWQSQPSLSADGTELFFAAKTGKGFGEIDLWVSKLDGNKWGDPINLGEKINTAGVEQCPYIHPDGKTLYFSSTGHLGMGRSDLYMVKRDINGVWGEPINLGYPINTSDDEGSLFVSADGTKGYYSKVQSNQLDLFEFVIPEHLKPDAVTFVKGIITDASTNNFIDADIEILNLNTEELVYKTTTSSFDGYFLTTLPIGENYIFNTSKANYLPYSNTFSLKDIKLLETYNLEIKLQPIPKVATNEVEKIVMKNIFFASGSDEIIGASHIELKKIIEILENNPKIKMTIVGHTDNVGNEIDNLTLSKKRAESVKSYLISKGVLANRLQTKGMGETTPIDTNDTETGRANNRRTEFIISF